MYMASFGQKSVADLKPAHALALEDLLSKSRIYEFLSEKTIDAKYLKTMREALGNSLTPFYQVGDFNQDKIIDFALILSRKGKPIDQDTEFSKEHRYRYKLAIVIFRGKKGWFQTGIL